MSGLYVYGITSRDARVRARGIFGRPLKAVAAGGLYVIVEPASKPPRPSVAALRKQNRALAALINLGLDVLPARFGSFVREPNELARAIRDRDAELRRALTRISGCVQMTVRARAKKPVTRSSASPPQSGATYLRDRAQRHAAGRSHPLVRQIERAARRYARASDVEWRESPFPYVRVHHLVPRTRVDVYREALVRALSKAEVEAIVTGPWAPFAFVEIA